MARGCYLGQGFLWSKPLPVRDLTALIAAPRRAEVAAGVRVPAQRG